jgi:hypothetical protein
MRVETDTRLDFESLNHPPADHLFELLTVGVRGRIHLARLREAGLDYPETHTFITDQSHEALDLSGRVFAMTFRMSPEDVKLVVDTLVEEEKEDMPEDGYEDPTSYVARQLCKGIAAVGQEELARDALALIYEEHGGRPEPPDEN